MNPGGARELERVGLASGSEGVCEEGRNLFADGLGGLAGNLAQWLFASRLGRPGDVYTGGWGEGECEGGT